MLGSFIARIGIFIAHDDFFAGLSWGEFFLSAARGLRYDIAALALVFLPALVLVLVPGQRWFLRYLRYLGYLLLSISAAFVVLFGVASTQFFAFFYRHLGVEVKTVFSDFDFILQMAVEQNLWALILVVVGLAVAGRLAYKTLPKLPVPHYGAGGYALRLGVTLLLGELLLWGGVGRQFVDDTHAFAKQDLRLGQLVLNPAFAGINNLFFPQSIEAAAAEFTALPTSENFNAPQALVPHSKQRGNVVLVILESWTPEFIGAFGAANSITPNFDAIAAQGRRYHQLYANGPISIYGLQALLTGMPHLPGMPLMGFGGVERLQLDGVATQMRNLGYKTLWAQAPRRASFNMDWLAQRWGFQHIAGSEDYHTPADWHKTPFGWDWPMYEYGLKTMAELPEPFFAALYTAVTHVPYVAVPEAQQLRPHDPEGVNGYINTLNRADWALTKFWQQAKQQPWHSSTTYIFVADHVVPKDMPDKSIRGRYRIPMVIVGPNIEAGDDWQMASQVDVLPTVLALAGQMNEAPQARNGVLSSDGATSYWLTPNSTLGHYRGKPVFAIEGDAEPTLRAGFASAMQYFYQRYLQLDNQ